MTRDNDIEYQFARAANIGAERIIMRKADTLDEAALAALLSIIKLEEVVEVNEEGDGYKATITLDRRVRDEFKAIQLAMKRVFEFLEGYEDKTIAPVVEDYEDLLFAIG